MEDGIPISKYISKEKVIEEIKELMNEDVYYKDVYEFILELLQNGREETAYKIYFLLNC
ncbi:MAG: hypothetical protein QXY87_04050 [Saccharolobus sp.]|uniref:hypothetical protein n=1 Tax=Sulfolobaceae TaxID=118883 RepID=UPI001F1019F4|nr:hypothetical protein [Saccharolobus shibatae]MCH4814969.1 hypothetical protein [Saccharolobus shibatae]